MISSTSYQGTYISHMYMLQAVPTKHSSNSSHKLGGWLPEHVTLTNTTQFHIKASRYISNLTLLRTQVSLSTANRTSLITVARSRFTLSCQSSAHVLVHTPMHPPPPSVPLHWRLLSTQLPQVSHDTCNHLGRIHREIR